MDLTSGEAEKDKRLRDRAGDERQNATAWLHDIRRLVQDDPKLAEYVDAVEIGCGEPAEIADVCQVDVTDICSRRRKLKRSSPAISMGGRRHDKEVEDPSDPLLEMLDTLLGPVEDMSAEELSSTIADAGIDVATARQRLY